MIEAPQQRESLPRTPGPDRSKRRALRRARVHAIAVICLFASAPIAYGADPFLRRTATVDVLDGINQVTWDLLLDPDLATAAERERVAEADVDTDSAEGPRTLASTPWAEAVRLERPVYVTPGDYTVRVEAGDGTSDVSFTVEEPEPRAPRTEPAPRIRGQRDDDAP